MLDETALERRVGELRRRLLAEMASEPPRHQGEWAWVDGLFGRLAGNDDLRVRALRFIDVLPTLGSDAELATHLREYLAEDEFPLPGLARWGLRSRPICGIASAIWRIWSPGPKRGARRLRYVWSEGPIGTRKP